MRCDRCVLRHSRTNLACAGTSKVHVIKVGTVYNAHGETFNGCIKIDTANGKVFLHPK